MGCDCSAFRALLVLDSSGFVFVARTMAAMATPGTLRLFIGLWPDAQTRDALQAQADGWRWPDAARRTRPERLHLTLHFLGPVQAQRVPEVQAALQVRWEGCTLDLDRAVVWPGGIAVLEAGRVPPALADVHAALAARLLPLGLPVDARPYRPHVTLARKATGARPPADAVALRWQAGPRLLLVQSLPGGGGYVPLAPLA